MHHHVAKLSPPAEGPAIDRGDAANGPCPRQEAGCVSELDNVVIGPFIVSARRRLANR